MRKNSVTPKSELSSYICRATTKIRLGPTTNNSKLNSQISRRQRYGDTTPKQNHHTYQIIEQNQITQATEEEGPMHTHNPAAHMLLTLMNWRSI
jgi:hypothetical protein